MTNFQKPLPRQSRGYIKTALTKGVETGVRKWSASRGAGWLLSKTAGKVASGPIGALLEVFWPSNTIVSGAEEMRMLREARMRRFQTSPPWEKFPQSILKPLQSGSISTSRPSLNDKLGRRSPSMQYKIQRGDTLSAIAHTHGVGLNNILRANPSITNANRIRAGANLNIPFH